MNAAVQMPFSSTPHYKTGANFCKQSFHKALEKYSPTHSDPCQASQFQLCFQIATIF